MEQPVTVKPIWVIIPDFEYRFVTAKKSRKSGRMRYWTINGQGLYNATMHYQLRSKLTNYYHKYLSKHITKQITNKEIQNISSLVFPDSPFKLAVSVDIYDQRRGKMPDVGNLWLWLKWFEDALQESGVIPDDNPDYVIESGRTRYHWIDNEDERKLVFKIEFIRINNQ